MAENKETLREFLVSIGWESNKAEHKTFVDAIELATTKSILMAKAIEEMAKKTFEALRSTTESFEGYFFTSSTYNTNMSNIRGLQSAYENLGSTSGKASSDIARLGEAIKYNDGAIRNILKSPMFKINPNQDPTVILKEIGKNLAATHDSVLLRTKMNMLNIDAETEGVLSNWEKVEELDSKSKAIAKKMGLSDNYAEKSAEFMERLRLTYYKVQDIFNKITIETAEGVKSPLELVDNWLIKNGPKITSEFSRIFESVKESLGKIDWTLLGEAVKKFSDAILFLANQVPWDFLIRNVDKVVYAFVGLVALSKGVELLLFFGKLSQVFLGVGAAAVSMGAGAATGTAGIIGMLTALAPYAALIAGLAALALTVKPTAANEGEDEIARQKKYGQFKDSGGSELPDELIVNGNPISDSNPMPTRDVTPGAGGGATPYGGGGGGTPGGGGGGGGRGGGSGAGESGNRIDNSGRVGKAAKSANALSMLDELKRSGMPLEGIAMTMGSAQAESSFDPGVINSIGMKGLFQWDHTRWPKIAAWIKAHGGNITDPRWQVRAFIAEGTAKKGDAIYDSEATRRGFQKLMNAKGNFPMAQSGIADIERYGTGEAGRGGMGRAWLKYILEHPDAGGAAKEDHSAGGAFKGPNAAPFNHADMFDKSKWEHHAAAATRIVSTLEEKHPVLQKKFWSVLSGFITSANKIANNFIMLGPHLESEFSQHNAGKGRSPYGSLNTHGFTGLRAAAAAMKGHANLSDMFKQHPLGGQTTQNSWSHSIDASSETHIVVNGVQDPYMASSMIGSHIDRTNADRQAYLQGTIR